MATPKQIRESIVRAFHDQGLTYEQVAEVLGVGRATVSRVLRRHRETGGVDPRPRGGGNFSPIRGALTDRLRALVTLHPDATGEELAAELSRQTGVRTSRSSIQRALVRMGYTRKKSPSSQSNATPQKT